MHQVGGTDVDRFLGTRFLDYSNGSVRDEDEEYNKRFDKGAHERRLVRFLEECQDERDDSRTEENEN